MKSIRSVLWILIALIMTAPSRAETKVTVKPAPFAGRRVRTITDAKDAVHFVFNREGNVFYSRRDSGTTEFSEPIRVNTIDKCAAVADLAVGADGRIHILYHGNIFYVRDRIKNENRKLDGRDIKYTFYSRLNKAGDSFEDQREMSGGVWGFDGGCAVAADPSGNVYLFFNGTTTAGGEQVRHVFLSRSTDNGDSFSKPAPIDLGKGVCACCHLSATVNAKGELLLVYRVAEAGVNRDSYLLTSRDQGKTFRPSALDHWELRACPGSLYSFATSGGSTFVSWHNQDDIYFAAAGSRNFLRPPDKTMKRRAAILGGNAKGEVLIAWSEGADFNKPHDLRWQLYDKTGQPIGNVGVKADAFERWGNPAIYADANGDFVILF
ncbi:MAG: exo-alpha-sialidase [Verrucomicrobia bacterium]|nr:exo-alpha-sialidase [Verrucomicrobiota bacterium]